MTTAAMATMATVDRAKSTRPWYPGKPTLGERVPSDTEKAPSCRSLSVDQGSWKPLLGNPRCSCSGHPWHARTGDPCREGYGHARAGNRTRRSGRYPRPGRALLLLPRSLAPEKAPGDRLPEPFYLRARLETSEAANDKADRHQECCPTEQHHQVDTRERQRVARLHLGLHAPLDTPVSVHARLLRPDLRHTRAQHDHRRHKETDRHSGHALHLARWRRGETVQQNPYTLGRVCPHGRGASPVHGRAIFHRPWLTGAGHP